MRKYWLSCVCVNRGPLVDELTRPLGAELGEANGILVLDPSAFPNKGTASVGVQR